MEESKSYSLTVFNMPHHNCLSDVFVIEDEDCVLIQNIKMHKLESITQKVYRLRNVISGVIT